jgi:hypothetical protein
MHDMSLSVKGVVIGTVSFRTNPFPDGVITRDCLEGLGWSFNQYATEIEDVPDQLWQTLVADRGPKGEPAFPWYETACQHCLTFQTNNGHINIGSILRHHVQDSQHHIVHSYLRRVRAVTWNRSFIKGDPLFRAASQECGADHEQLVSFGPPKTAMGDIVAILYGCSVPIVLRPMLSELGELQDYRFVGEAYIYGKMDGEAIEEQHQTKTFKLL